MQAHVHACIIHVCEYVCMYVTYIGYVRNSVSICTIIYALDVLLSCDGKNVLEF